MTSPIESKFADELRALGFEKYERRAIDSDMIIRVSAIDDDESEKTEMPVRAVINREPPYFTTFTGLITVTLAVDETGQHWMHRTQTIDLDYYLGFKNLFEWHPVS